MSIAIRYYSKGGNTEKLAKAAEEAAGVQALSVAEPLTEMADVLFLGCSYYAFDMDPEVKQFLKSNQDKIGKIVLFGSSAMMKSMKKPLVKVLKSVDADIKIAEEEFHCKGEFKMMNTGRPNADDLSKIKDFVQTIVNA